MCCQYQFQTAMRGRLAWGLGDGLGYIFSLWWLALHQHGWAMVPRYVVKHSECFWEAIWGCFKLHLNWWKFEGADCPPTCGWALSNQLEACLAQKPDLLQARGNSAADSLWTWVATAALPASPACQPTLQILDLPVSVTTWTSSHLHELEVEWWCRVGQDRSAGEWC